MSLADELLETARYLLRRNQNRPSQGDLRRAISTAYYALFHRLIDDAVARLVVDAGQRDVVARAYSHTEMKKACQSVQKSPLPKPVDTFFVTGVPSEVLSIAKLFVLLQEIRHEADYNRGKHFTRLETRDLLARMEPTLRDWDRVKPTPEGQGFLVLLLLGDRCNR
jgi:uncharacterized protein (UPF0332 family)